MTANTEPKAAGSDSVKPNVWGVRADGGEYTDHLVRGGYVAYGGQKWGDFSDCRNKQEVKDKLAPFFPNKRSLAAYAGMMASFLWGIQADDWVITPEKDSNLLRYGEVQPGDYWYAPGAPDGCPYPMRRKIVWAEQPLKRDKLPGSLQNTLKFTAKTVFAVAHRKDFLCAKDKQPCQSSP